ncbi:SIR2 family protein [Mycobacterium sp. EPG1]|nr:SIR2 family protein [Mycobacterium sp. EPG1]
MGGHLFIINGDLTKLACDAVLIPTDAASKVEAHWHAVVDSRDTKIPRPWGADRVATLTYRPGGPLVILGNVGQHGVRSGFDAFEPVVREFVLHALKELNAAAFQDRKRIYAWPKPRLAVNLVGSGLGGGAAKKGDLVQGLIQALTTLATENDVDIVLVTYGDKPYAAAQRARRKCIGPNELSDTWRFAQDANPKLIEKAHQLAEDAIDRQLVLFIGAGVSAGAGLPTWRSLMNDVAKQAGFGENERKRLAKKDLRDQATLIEQRLAETSEPLKSRVAVALKSPTRYALAHGLLASLPSTEAVTTNFDTLFELASKVRGRDVAVLPEDPRTTGGRLLLKLHGSVSHPDRMVLTRADYLKMPRDYGALMGLVQGLLLMRRMVFVGYSLTDEDFHELIDEVRAARGEGNSGVGRGVVLTLQRDHLEEQLWENDLDIIPMIARGETDIPTAARELELFLDLVGYLSTTSASFFLDEAYDDLSDDEKGLREALRALAKDTAGSDLDTVSHLVEKFLKRLGA